MSTNAIHLDDGDVVRLLDDAASPEERETWEAHTAGCGRCADQLAREERLLRAVSAELALLEVPEGTRRPVLPAHRVGGLTTETRPGAIAPAAGETSAPRPWWSEGWLRAAAAIVVVGGVVGTVEPLRAWVGGRWDALAAAVLGDTPETTPAAVTESSPTRLWFEAPRGTFRVEVSARQTSGTLTLRRSEDRRGMLELRGAASPLLSDREVRIETSAGSTASYVVALPSSVTEVRVRVAGDAERTVTGEEIERGFTLELGGP